MATETLGQTEVLRKINTTLSFLDELGRAEIRLGEENISCELMQSVYIPRDVSPDLLVKFSERVTVKKNK